MAAKDNVVSRKTSTHFQWTFVFLLLLVCQKYGAAEECDLIKCIENASSFISELRGGTAFSCGKFLNISGCSDYCMRKYYPSIFSHSDTNQLSIGEFCTRNVASRSNVSWSCIARHTFRLLTCLANISSLTSNNVYENVKESCRKSVELSECPSKVLLPVCGEKSVEAVKDMLHYAVDYFMPFPCKDQDVKHILSMPVNYYLGQDFMKLARCFDSIFINIYACFLQIIRNERDMYDFICEDNALGRCIQFDVSKNCAGSMDKAPSVRTLLLKLFSLGGVRCDKSLFVFKQLPSQEFLDPLLPESSTDGKMNKNGQQFPLNDEIFTPNPLFETTSFQTTKSKELIQHKNMNNTKYDINHDVNSSKLHDNSDVENANDSSQFVLSKVHKGDTSVEHHSENPIQKDIDYFKTSKGTNLLWDKTVYCIILSIIISKMHHSTV